LKLTLCSASMSLQPIAFIKPGHVAQNYAGIYI